jgi:hypothetical protein
MTNTSATGGYLAPANSPAPLEDAALVAFLQQIFVGLTGLSGNMVRPRWQKTPPNQPEAGVAWMAFGIVNRPADTFAYEIHDPSLGSGNGADIMERNEELEILCSFYGDTADTIAALTRDGLQIGQNREALQLAGMALIECGNIKAAPNIVNAQWYNRADMVVRIRRAVVRVYPILQLLTAGVVLETDNGITENINVTQ